MKETIEIYYYTIGGVKYYTPNLILASSRTDNGHVGADKYEVDIKPTKA
jgi:hypothetical protein